MIEGEYMQKIHSEKIKGYKERCTECRDGSSMTSSEYLYQDKFGNWYMEFLCDRNKESIKLWDEKYESTINEALKENNIEPPAEE